MTIHQTGWTGEVVAPCGHCNSKDEGPEPGVCHRGMNGKTACRNCLKTEHGDFGVGGAFVLGLTLQTLNCPCSKCGGTGYKRIA